MCLIKGGNEFNNGDCVYTCPVKKESNESLDWTKVWRYITGMKIELVFLFYALPGYINFIGLDLFPIEKACRINLNFSDVVCSNLNNGHLKSSCGDIYDFFSTRDEMNKTHDDFQKLLIQIGKKHNISNSDLGILEGVCLAETEAQKLKVEVNQSRAPLGYLALFVLILAGPLGDKYNRKKPFLLLPMIGELISAYAYLTTSFFQTAVPMEFHMYLERVLYSLTGGFSLMIMGVFSFLAATTTEEERTFRFAMFSAFNAGIGIAIQPLATVAFESLGYVYLFLFCVLVHLFGCIYIIFFIQEIPKQDIKGVDNAGFESNEQNIEKRSKPPDPETLEKPSKSIFSDGFKLCFSNFMIFHIPRPYSARKILLIVIIGYILIPLTNGELEIFVLFGRESWNWTTEFAVYQSYNTFIAFTGTLIVTGLLVEVWKLTDPILVMISLTCSIIAKPIRALTKDFPTIYIAATIEMFNSTRFIAVRSLISKIVAADELGRVYSVMSVIETLINPVSVIIYNQVYKKTICSFPGTFYFLTVGIFVVIWIIYLEVNVLVRKFVKAQGAEEKTDINDNVQKSSKVLKV